MANNISWLQVITAINYAVHLKKNLSRYNKLLLFVPTTKNVASAGRANARRKAKRQLYYETSI
ncbi:hypothetical protein MAH4_09670 [Sessilibacter sp. MAH4]